MQSIDELRHVQTQIHAMSHYNKFFDGFQDWRTCMTAFGICLCLNHFEDARSAGPFEFY